MNSENVNDDEFVEQWITASKQLPKLLPEILSTLLAKPIAPDSQQEIKKEANNILEIARAVFPELSDIKSIESDTERNDALLNMINTGLRPFFGELPQGKSVLDFIIDFLDPRVPLSQGSYLLETSYNRYMDIVTKLAVDTVKMVPLNKYQEFLELVFSSTEDVLSIGQTVMTKFPRMHKEFSFQRKRFTKKQAERDIQYYDELAGHFEKCIAVVAGVIKLINGEKATYGSMRRRGLARNLKTVSRSEYSYLTTGFDINIRNALAHKQSHCKPEKCTVYFYDPRSEFSVEYSYREMSRKTKELCALLISVYRLPILIWVETLVRYRDTLKQKDESSG